MSEGKSLEHILRRLNILISLELEKPAPGGKVPMAARIQRLYDLGISVSAIAQIINKPANYVTATISQRRKARRKKGGENGD